MYNVHIYEHAYVCMYVYIYIYIYIYTFLLEVQELAKQVGLQLEADLGDVPTAYVAICVICCVICGYAV